MSPAILGLEKKTNPFLRPDSLVAIEGFVPRRVRCAFRPVGPVAAGDRLDDHEAGILAVYFLGQCLIRLPVRRVTPQHRVQWRQNGGERKAAKRLEVDGRCFRAVAGDSHRAD
jgi:hypothetical protein